MSKIIFARFFRRFLLETCDPQIDIIENVYQIERPP